VTKLRKMGGLAERDPVLEVGDFGGRDGWMLLHNVMQHNVTVT
jgi:hypothetical protein